MSRKSILELLKGSLFTTAWRYKTKWTKKETELVVNCSKVKVGPYPLV